MKPHRVALISCLIFLAATRVVAAQTALLFLPIDSGRVVRFQLHGGDVQRGRLLAPLCPTSIRMVFCWYPGHPCTAGDSAGIGSVLTADLSRLDVVAGTRWRTGALIGALFGIPAGAVGHAFASDPDAGSGHAAPAAQYLVIGALGGALWGAIFGAGFDAWRPAP